MCHVIIILPWLLLLNNMFYVYPSLFVIYNIFESYFLFLDADGLICQALLTGNFEAAVDVCFKEERMADGLLLAIAGGPDLFSRTQKRYLEQAKSPLAKVRGGLFREVCRTLSNISKMNLFPKIVNGLQPLTVSAKSPILDVWDGSQYLSIFCLVVWKPNIVSSVRFFSNKVY